MVFSTGPMKLRIMLIGAINAIIGVVLIHTRGFSDLIMGYILVGVAVFVIGLILK